MRRQQRWASYRDGSTSPVVVALLAGILLAIVALIVVMVVGPKGDESVGNTAKPKPSHKPVGDPNRIKETLKAGKTYRAVLKTGFTCRTEDQDYGVKVVVNMLYEAELVVNRKIESNDGHRVVELRHFESARNVKLLTTVDGISFDFGGLGDLVLSALDSYQPGTTTLIASLQPLVTGMLRSDAERVLQDANTKAFAHVDSLSGKTVRVVYSDARGVESVQPVNCTLSPEEQGFLEATAVVSDCHLMDLNLPPGEPLSVDAGQLAGLIDPSLRGVPVGQVSIRREQDSTMNGVNTAHLRVESSVVTIESTSPSRHRTGRFVPQGTLDYNLVDNYVNAGQLQGDFKVEEVSTDHILFKAEMKSNPKLLVVYSCQMQ